MAFDTATSESPDPAQAELDRQTRLQAFADSLVGQRDEAIAFKKTTGVEEEWNEDEDYYNAKDPFAKKEEWTKGRNQTDGLQGGNRHDTGSDIFDNITAYHVDMRAARATDMLTPADDKPFAIKPTPMPDVSKAKDDPAAQTTMVTNAQGQQTTMAAAITLMLAEATKSAEDAEAWIWDKFIEFNWHAEFRKCIHEAHKIGNWVMKGPYPVRRKFKTVSKTGNQIEIVIGESIEPASRAIDPRNLFPDPACYPSENIQKGNFIWEKDEITYRQLREMRGLMIEGEDGSETPMYLDDQIDLCLKEGPTPDINKTKPYEKSDKDLFTIWYGYVNANQKDMEAAGCKCEETDSVPAQITMVNDRVIQATLSVLDAGEYPYDILVLERRPGTPWGKGISRKVRVQQREVNGLQRAWMKNAGLCAGPMMGFLRTMLNAADGGPVAVRPFAVFDISPEVGDIKKAITFAETPSRQQELLAGIQFALQRANDLVGNSPQDQGQMSESPETKGGRIILQNNSNAPQRQIARNADDGVIEPHVKRYYAYWLAHAEGDKGTADHQIEALGSSALFERDAEQQSLLQLWSSGLAANPDSRIDINKLTIELTKGNKINPDRIRFSDDEWAEKQKQMAANPPPPPPNVQAAQIKAESDQKIAATKAQADVQTNQTDMDRDAVFQQAELARSNDQHQYNMLKLSMEERIAQQKENGDMARKMKDIEAKYEEMKTSLAEKTMELKLQQELSMREIANGKPHPGIASPQVATTPVQTPGRAPDGQAFAQ